MVLQWGGGAAEKGFQRLESRSDHPHGQSGVPGAAWQVSLDGVRGNYNLQHVPEFQPGSVPCSDMPWFVWASLSSPWDVEMESWGNSLILTLLLPLRVVTLPTLSMPGHSDLPTQQSGSWHLTHTPGAITFLLSKEGKLGSDPNPGIYYFPLSGSQLY